MNHQQIAEAACKSVYGSCSTGTCGSFYYYRYSSSKSCSCNKAVGQYEFIYRNDGYTEVGGGYGGASTSIAGNSLFVRRKASSGCNSNSWNLALSKLGRGKDGNMKTA